MYTLSEQYPGLQPFNKQASGRLRNIRVGVTVETPRGLGIVTWRKGDKLEIAVRPDRVGELMPCYRYNYELSDVTISEEQVAEDDRLFAGAWYWVFNYAIHDNQKYEAIKHRAIFDEFEASIPGKRTDREVSCGVWGSAKYRRYTGVNKHGQPFDFELNLKPAFAFPYGDRVLYAMGASDGFIYDMNGHGRFYRRRMTEQDVNYGLAKYAGPQEEAN